MLASVRASFIATNISDPTGRLLTTTQLIDYYLPRKGLVIQDVSPFVPELVAAAVEGAETEEE